MRRALSLAAFVLIQLLLLPVTLVGATLYKLGRRSARHRQRVSRTAYGVLFQRWMMHATRGRADPTAGRLLVSPSGSLD